MANPNLPILPLARKIIVEAIPLESVTKGGIILEDKFTKRDHANRGRVVAIGPEAFDDAVPEFEVGDEVFFPRYAGDTIDVGDKSYRSIERFMISGLVNKSYSIEEGDKA